MIIKFDKNKCLKLLKEKEQLMNQGKILNNSNKAKYDELMSYLTLMEDEIFYRSRAEYVRILDLFITKKINFNQLCNQFGQLRGTNIRSVVMLEKTLEQRDIQFSPKSTGFAEIISELHSLIDLSDPDITLKMNLNQPDLMSYGLSEEFLKLAIKEELLPLLKEYCNKP